MPFQRLSTPLLRLLLVTACLGACESAYLVVERGAPMLAQQQALPTGGSMAATPGATPPATQEYEYPKSAVDWSNMLSYCRQPWNSRKSDRACPSRDDVLRELLGHLEAKRIANEADEIGPLVDLLSEQALLDAVQESTVGDEWRRRIDAWMHRTARDVAEQWRAILAEAGGLHGYVEKTDTGLCVPSAIRGRPFLLVESVRGRLRIHCATPRDLALYDHSETMRLALKVSGEEIELDLIGAFGRREIVFEVPMRRVVGAASTGWSRAVISLCSRTSTTVSVTEIEDETKSETRTHEVSEEGECIAEGMLLVHVDPGALNSQPPFLPLIPGRDRRDIPNAEWIDR